MPLLMPHVLIIIYAHMLICICVGEVPGTISLPLPAWAEGTVLSLCKDTKEDAMIRSRHNHKNGMRQFL